VSEEDDDDELDDDDDDLDANENGVLAGL